MCSVLNKTLYLILITPLTATSQLQQNSPCSSITKRITNHQSSKAAVQLHHQEISAPAKSSLSPSPIELQSLNRQPLPPVHAQAAPRLYRLLLSTAKENHKTRDGNSRSKEPTRLSLQRLQSITHTLGMSVSSTKVNFALLKSTLDNLFCLQQAIIKATRFIGSNLISTSSLSTCTHKLIVTDNIHKYIFHVGGIAAVVRMPPY